MYEDYGQDQTGPQDQYGPQPGMTRVESKDPGFLQWFLNNKEGLEELKMVWRGYEQNEKGAWQAPKNNDRRTMNEKGIHWSTSIMTTYLNKVFQATSWNEEHMNYEMRKAYRSVWLGLAFYYKDFEISKVNTQIVANGILAQIHAMLLSARAEGIRAFLTKTQSVSEIRNMNPQNPGFFSGLSGIFNKKKEVYQ